MIIAKRLKWLRETNRYAQKEVAAEMSLSLNGYQKIEYGDREPKIEGLIKLAKFYNVSTDFIIGKNDHTSSLEKKYQNLLNNQFALDMLGRAYTFMILQNYNLSEEEKKIQTEFLGDLSFGSDMEYKIELRNYINEIIFVPEFNPYKNDVLKDLFPIKFKVTEEMNQTYTIRIFTKDGNDIASHNDTRYEHFEVAKKEEELRNSLVSKYWINGVEPEESDYQKYLF